MLNSLTRGTLHLGIGRGTARRLLTACGSPEAVFATPQAVLRDIDPVSLAAMEADIAAAKAKADLVIVALHKGITHVPAALADYERPLARAAVEFRRMLRELLDDARRLTLDEIAANDYSLTPGRYVGVAAAAEDDEDDFAETLRGIQAELAELNDKAVELAARIANANRGHAIACPRTAVPDWV